jgi:hypothetical protein
VNVFGVSGRTALTRRFSARCSRAAIDAWK